jgi:hypothetical protein
MEKMAADITDGKGSGRRHIRGNAGLWVAFLRSGLCATLQGWYALILQAMSIEAY